MNNINKISVFEAIALIVIAMLNNIILTIPSYIVKNTSSGAWLNILLVSILMIIFAILIYKLFKNFPYMDIIDISEFIGGKILKILIGISFIIMFLIISSNFLRGFSELLQQIFLKHSPLIFTTAFFLFGIIIANKLGISSIAKITSISVIISLISFIILIISLKNYYNIYNLFPILGYGAKETFLTNLTNIYAFSGIAILFFIKPFLANEKDFKKISILSTILSGVLLLFCILNQLLLFGSVFNSQILTGMVLSSRIINFGNFFERVDAIFTFIWIFSQISYLSIAIAFILYIIKKITNTHDQNGMLYSVILLLLGISIIPKNYLELSNIMLHVSNTIKIILIFIVTPVILILANIKFKKKRKNISS